MSVPEGPIELQEIESLKSQLRQNSRGNSVEYSMVLAFWNELVYSLVRRLVELLEKSIHCILGNISIICGTSFPGETKCHKPNSIVHQDHCTAGKRNRFLNLLPHPCFHC